MTDEARKLRFALDQNFPAPVLVAFEHAKHWDGLVTNDDKLLALPKEMTVLSQTRLTLVVAVGEGHSPIRSVGLLLCHLNHICHHSKPDRPQIWKLRVAQKDYEEPRRYLEQIAEKSKTTADAIFQANKLPTKALRTSGN